MNKLKNILLIDDDHISSWLNKTIIEQMDVAEEITCMYDSREALKYLQDLCEHSDAQAAEESPDLIFLDLNMPNLSGFQLLDKLQQQEKCQWLIRERIVVLTTSISKIDHNKASNYPTQQYLIKPLSEESVKEVVAKVLQQAAAQQPVSGAKATKARGRTTTVPEEKSRKTT